MMIAPQGFMTKPINSAIQAKRFICELYFSGNMYHFSCDAEELVDRKGNRVFSDDVCKVLDKRVEEVFNWLDDPFELCVALTNN
jgi:hypothetical protein